MSFSWCKLTSCVVLLSLGGFVRLPVDGKPVVSHELLDVALFGLPSDSLLKEEDNVRAVKDTEDVYDVLRDVKVVKRQAVRNKTRLWPGGVVPYVLDKKFTPDVIASIEESMREVEQNVGNSTHPCVRFVPRTTEVNYLYAQDGNGCSSVIGLDYTGPQVSTYSPLCAVKGLLLHELLHTLGIYHEQDRFDRDQYIIMNSSNLRADAERNYVVKNMSDIDTLGTPYDFTSIMHYGPYSFPKDSRYPVMIPKPKYATGTYMGQRFALSRSDVLRVQRLYNCPEDTTHMQSDITRDKVLFWCDFENGTCAFSVSASQTGVLQGEQDENSSLSTPEPSEDLLWVTTRRATVDGPKTGSTNGLDPFFYASVKIQAEHSKNYLDPDVFTGNTAAPYDLSQSSTGPSTESDSQAASPSPSDESQEISLNVIQEVSLLDFLSQESPITDNITQAASLSNHSADTTTPQTPNSTLPTSKATVSLTTPIFTTGDMCLDFRLFQQGPGSFLDLYVKGPSFERSRFYTLAGQYHKQWLTVRMSLPLSVNVDFQLEFVTVLGEGSVSLDDVHLLKGVCQ